ncbi:MAG: hypothetical protein WC596_02315 [Candidatus Shapirobacteria bacterium]
MTDVKLVRSSEESIKDHLRTYYQALESGQPVTISSLIPSYRRLMPSLHSKLNDPKIDFPALNYCLARLPSCIFDTQTILIGQNLNQFQQENIDFPSFKPVKSSARRRLWSFDDAAKTLACIISSDSDIDDLVNILICFFIEWQKIKTLSKKKELDLTENENHEILGINGNEWSGLKNLLGDDWRHDLTVSLPDYAFRLLGHNFDSYTQTSRDWWQQAKDKSLTLGLSSLPIYFISSNTHSLTNIIGGFVKHEQGQIFSYIEKSHPQLAQIWQKIKTGQNDVKVNDFLYYISNIYLKNHPQAQRDKEHYEANLGIKNITVNSSLFSGIQIIPISTIANSINLDGNLNVRNKEKLSQSQALIINIDYPLGFAAYYLLSTILVDLKQLKGVYLVGKAAILTGVIGDIQISKSVFDERTGNIFHLKNIFNNNFPFIGNQSDVLHDQKTICVFGTFLENSKQLNDYIGAGFNIIEMESGAYLTAIAETILHKKLPQNEVINVDNLPFDLGIINYASDNPLSKNLGEGNLALRGVEPTYLALLSVVQRIIDLESA